MKKIFSSLMTSALSLLLVLVHLTDTESNVLNKTKNGKYNWRIVGGTKSEITNYPYTVEYGQYCAGAIITNIWVVTAAHCGKKMFILAGGNDRGKGTRYPVYKSFIHPEWSVKQKIHNFDFDYQLVKLDKKLVFSNAIQPIQIGDITDMVVGSYVTVTGWGVLSVGGEYTRELRSIKVPIVSKEECNKVKFTHFNGKLTPRMFCAGKKQGFKDACQGDSGGPAVTERRVLIGLVSFGYGCATPNSYGVYSKLPIVRDWIEKTADIKIESTTIGERATINLTRDSSKSIVTVQGKTLYIPPPLFWNSEEHRKIFPKK